ncbi:unnamed protein product [Cladocopium goreaui]|uniref:Dinoflagellate viral nucleoprotein 5 (DNVP5) n=1 Tax=Cladocopium goreaui TaxID=2562237 RepID=A0A9P1GD93_9DINO|nr:unnamed protein product [Cladocopium goreaui]
MAPDPCRYLDHFTGLNLHEQHEVIGRVVQEADQSPSSSAGVCSRKVARVGLLSWNVGGISDHRKDQGAGLEEVSSGACAVCVGKAAQAAVADVLHAAVAKIGAADIIVVGLQEIISLTPSNAMKGTSSFNESRKNQSFYGWPETVAQWVEVLLGGLNSGPMPSGPAGKSFCVAPQHGESWWVFHGSTDKGFGQRIWVVCLLSSLPAEAHSRLWHGREANGLQDQIRSQVPKTPRPPHFLNPAARAPILAAAVLFALLQQRAVIFIATMALPMKTVMKAMKSAKATAMKAKVMKKKAVSKIATGKRAKVAVFKGRKEKTVSGLKREHLMINKRGKVVSKKMNAAGKNRFKQISAWINACQSARNELGIKGMCCVGGKTVQGKALYVKAKAIFGKCAKGAVACRFVLWDRSFCFLNCHLAATTSNSARISARDLRQRLRQLEQCWTEIKFKSHVNQMVYPVSAHRAIFLLGDTNMRLVHKSDINEDFGSYATKTISAKENGYRQLWSLDQLCQELGPEPQPSLREHKIRGLGLNVTDEQFLSQWQEPFVSGRQGPPFPPTFKLAVPGPGYSKKRVPAWTDRVLYSSDHAEPLKYGSLQQSQVLSPPHNVSDHDPVYAFFDVECMGIDPRRLGLLARQVRGESRETRRSPGKTSDFAMETTKKAAISKANIIFQIFQFLLSVLWSVGFQ